MMRIGVTFPQTEFGVDPGAVREYAIAAEQLGYSHILAYDHVVGADVDQYQPWRGPYTHRHQFLEPIVLFSHMAAVTKQIEFTTGIIILPQRQAVLVAKQAATVDVLSGGRLRLGIGIGWNQVEYQVLGENFHNRGRRVEEQVEVMRKLWTEPLVNFEGQWHKIAHVGINPLPVQRPIPIWFGGHADAVLRRVAAMGDGWMPLQTTAEEARPSLQKLTAYVNDAGRDMAQIGLEPRLPYGNGDRTIWQREIEAWQKLGATHLSVNTMGVGFQGPGQHLGAIREFAQAIALEKV